jgi:hypothetical protein
VTSHINARFRGQFTRLPQRIQAQARQAYRLFIANPAHPGLEFKKLPPFSDIWSVRINDNYRAVGQREGESIVWFFIGTHADYDALLARL